MPDKLSYQDVSSSLTKYGCQLLYSEDEYNQLLRSKNKKINIRSKCGHENKGITLYGFVRDKKHVYCNECIESGKYDERECIRCRKLFKTTKGNQHYCSRVCSHIKDLSEEVKDKIKNTLLNRYKDRPKKIKIKKGILKVTYEELFNLFEINSCKLLTTKEEYLAMKGHHKKVKIVSSCGHITQECPLNEFKGRGTGIKCKECVIDQMKEKAKINSKDNDKNIVALQTEFKSYIKIKDLIIDGFYIERTNEGCLADIIIKPKSVDDDLWLPIQLKSTSVIKNIYSFHLHNEYNDMLIILHSLIDDKMWCINGNLVKGKTKIGMGLGKSKYDIYSIESSNIANKLEEFYKEYKLSSKSTINIPITERHQKENKFRKLREYKLSGIIKFDYPDIQYQHHDFMISIDKTYKIQEKVGSHVKNRKNIYFGIYKKRGIDNIVPYDKGDNDFYWLNMPDEKTFYVIPENILLEEGYIKDDEHIGGKYISLYYEYTDNIKTKWAVDYKFDYDNIDKDKLLKMFGINNEVKQTGDILLN
jgi:hypothetical protein